MREGSTFLQPICYGNASEILFVLGFFFHLTTDFDFGTANSDVVIGRLL